MFWSHPFHVFCMMRLKVPSAFPKRFETTSICSRRSSGDDEVALYVSHITGMGLLTSECVILTLLPNMSVLCDMCLLRSIACCAFPSIFQGCFRESFQVRGLT
jgi:hypothetical protein